MILSLIFPLILQAQSQRDVFPNAIWKCDSSSDHANPNYELNIYRRKGDKRYQFVLSEIKPKKIVVADLAENMDLDSAGKVPVKTGPSKMLFSFEIDYSEKKKPDYPAKLLLDQSHDRHHQLLFDKRNPLNLICRLP